MYQKSPKFKNVFSVRKQELFILDQPKVTIGAVGDRTLHYTYEGSRLQSVDKHEIQSSQMFAKLRSDNSCEAIEVVLSVLYH